MTSLIPKKLQESEHQVVQLTGKIDAIKKACDVSEKKVQH